MDSVTFSGMEEDYIRLIHLIVDDEGDEDALVKAFLIISKNYQDILSLIAKHLEESVSKSYAIYKQIKEALNKDA